MNPYDLKAGDRFEFCGKAYTATSDARGEFNTYVDVEGDAGSIVIPHGCTVRKLGRALAPLPVITSRAVEALVAYQRNGGTAKLREIAGYFVDVREHFLTNRGEPDWLGRSHGYRQWVSETMGRANVPAGNVSALQAAIRYHVSAVVRERLDADELEALGLVRANGKERCRENRRRRTEDFEALKREVMRLRAG